MNLLLDAGPALNFLAVGQQGVLIQLAAAGSLQLAAPERVDHEVRGKAQADRFRRTGALGTWQKMTAAGRIQLLSDALEDRPVFRSAIYRISGMPAADRVHDGAGSRASPASSGAGAGRAALPSMNGCCRGCDWRTTVKGDVHANLSSYSADARPRSPLCEHRGARSKSASRSGQSAGQVAGPLTVAAVESARAGIEYPLPAGARYRHPPGGDDRRRRRRRDGRQAGRERVATLRDSKAAQNTSGC